MDEENEVEVDSILQVGDFRLPGWAAPLVGLGMGTTIATMAAGGFHPLVAGFGAGIGLIAGGAVWIMDYIERAADPAKSPNAWVTGVLLLLTPVICWVPILGFLFVAYSLRRCKWLSVPDILLLPFALTYFAAIGSSMAGVAALLMVIWR